MVSKSGLRASLRVKGLPEGSNGQEIGSLQEGTVGHSEETEGL